MAYNHGREDRKWRIWKEAEEKLLRECGVDEATIEQIRMADRADFNSNRRFYRWTNDVAEYLEDITFKRDIWTEMFEAAKAEKQNDQSELVPFWCFGKNQSVKIERLVPMYPMSKDEVNYERLIKILSLYRLTLGQARQEELLEYLFKEFKETSGLKKLFIDLSPFSKGKEG